MTDLSYSISEVAQAFRLPVSTLRYYDDIGLVTAPTRHSRIRHYDRTTLERLAYVQLWGLDAGLSLQRTAAIVSATHRKQRNTLIEQSVEEIAHRIDQLTEAPTSCNTFSDAPWTTPSPAP
jgi:DNA-binding transcriptional MerR regulator